MSSTVTTLARRGMEMAMGPDNKLGEFEMPAWGWAILISTFALFFLVQFMIDYTFTQILPTLAMIEIPSEAISFEPLPTEPQPEDQDPSINKSAEPTNSKPEYITSNLRRFYRHLRTVGGIRGPFRGFWIYVVNVMAVSSLTSVLSVVPILNLLPRAFPAVVSMVLCAQLSLAWTHIVISEPSPKTWLRRIPSMKTWRIVAAPTLILAAAQSISAFVPLYVGMAIGLIKENLSDVPKANPGRPAVIISEAFGLWILTLVLNFLLVLPARVVLARVQASLLPETDETIVPFDRSFEGKVVPQIVGGSGAISMSDAWSTFDMSARIRVVKVYAKAFLLQTLSVILFAVVVGLEFGFLPWKLKTPEEGSE